MTPRDKIIEVMARAIAAHEQLSPKYAETIKEELEDMAMAALTTLESSGYIVRPREATERMIMAGGNDDLRPIEVETIDTAMTSAWEKEQNDE